MLELVKVSYDKVNNRSWEGQVVRFLSRPGKSSEEKLEEYLLGETIRHFYLGNDGKVYPFYRIRCVNDPI